MRIPYCVWNNKINFTTCFSKFSGCVFIISLLSLLLRHRRFLWITHKQDGPRGPSTGWWVLTTANTAGINGLTCLPKHGWAHDSKFLVTHPMTDQRCLTSKIARRSALPAGPSKPPMAPKPLMVRYEPFIVCLCLVTSLELNSPANLLLYVEEEFFID
jgi:hypothetical protein